jgi:glycosidase
MSGARRRPRDYGTDANDIGVREAFRWTKAIESEQAATWYKQDADYWNKAFNKPGDGVSVEEQAHDPNSLLSYYKSLIDLRQGNRALASGLSEVLPSGGEIIAIKRSSGQYSAVLIVNLTNRPADVRIPSNDSPVFLFGDHSLQPGAGEITGVLPPYGVSVWQIGI